MPIEPKTISFQSREELLTHVQNSLQNLLRATTRVADEWRAERIEMSCINATTHQRCEVCGDAQRVTKRAITFLENTPSDVVGLFIKVGTYRIRVKANHHIFRLTVAQLEHAL